MADIIIILCSVTQTPVWPNKKIVDKLFVANVIVSLKYYIYSRKIHYFMESLLLIVYKTN